MEADGVPSHSTHHLIEPVLKEVRTHVELQTRAAEAKDFEAIVANARSHAQRLTDAVTTIANYDSVRDAALGNLPVDDSLMALLAGTRSLLNAQVASVLLMDDDQDLLWPRASSGFQTVAGVRPVSVNGTVRNVVRTGEPLLVEEVGPEDVFRPDLRKEGIRSLVAVPMKVGDAVKGVLLCGHRAPNHFGPRDVDLLQHVADRMMVGLERRRALRVEAQPRPSAEATSQFKADLLHMATHDVKAPLTVLSVQLDVLAQPEATEDQKRRAINVMHRNIQRATQMLDDFLDLARVQSGHLTLRRQRLDAAKLIRETVETFDEHAKQKGLRLKATGPPRLEAYGDERRLMQVLTNLVSNAIRYSPAGGTVQASATEADHHVEFEVVDEGRGFTEEQLSRLFQPFVQVHGIPEEAQGTGLGLYLCKGIINAHGSTLSVTSPGPGKGTKVFFTVPKKKPA